MRIFINNTRKLKKKLIKASSILAVVALIFYFDEITQQHNLNSTRKLLTGEEDQTATRRPVMHTFYQKLDEGEDELIQLWSEEWEKAGFETKVLTLDDAKQHPYFETMEAAVSPIFGYRYNALCFFRWLAMAQDGGGWMSDYDTLPAKYQLLEEEGSGNLPKDGKFVTFDNHIPSLMSGSSEEWLRLCKLLVENISKSDSNLPSDMNVFKHVLTNVSDHGVTQIDQVYKGFAYLSDGKVDCEGLKSTRAIHMSHRGTHIAWEKKLLRSMMGVYNPKGRTKAMGDYVKDYREQCLQY